MTMYSIGGEALIVKPTTNKPLALFIEIVDNVTTNEVEYVLTPDIWPTTPYWLALLVHPGTEYA